MDDIEVIKNCEPILNNNIVLYGGGYCGERARVMLEKLGVRVKAVCTTDEDADIMVKGIRHVGIPELKEMDDREDLLIVLATSVNKFAEEMLGTLDRHGIVRGKRITYLALCYACVLNGKIDKDGRLSRERELWHKWGRIKNLNYMYQNLRKCVSEDPIVVYNPAKVGSTTLYNSFEKCGIPSVHMHTIQKESVYYTPCYLDGRIAMPEKCFEDHEKFLECLKDHGKTRVITAVREPIARDISLFFSVFFLPYSRWVDQSNDVYRDFQRMIGGFAKAVDQFDWMNRELENVFGINVYRYPFDREKGYGIIREGNVSVLILKLEKLHETSSVIADFAQAENFVLANKNEAKEKPYRYMYQEFKENVTLPQTYVDRYYRDNPCMNHFYSQQEREMFLQKWGKHIID